MPTTLDRAVEADEIVSALRGYGFTQGDVARAVGVSDRAVRNWSRETTLRRRHEERLQALRQIVLLLSDSLTPRGAGQWFRAHHRTLGGRRPLDVLADGRKRGPPSGCCLRRRRVRLTLSKRPRVRTKGVMNVLPRRHLSRRVRHQTRPRNALLQFEDPATYDGRYHRAGGPGAWYASLTERGAWAELFRHWGQHEISPFEVRRRVGRARVTDLAVLDLIDPAVRSQLAVTEADLTGDSLATRHKSLPRRLAQTVSKGSWRLWRPRWRDHPGRLPRSDGQGGR